MLHIILFILLILAGPAFSVKNVYEDENNLKGPEYSEINFQAPKTYPSSIRHMEFLVGADTIMYEMIKNYPKSEFTKRQKEICKEFIDDYEKVPKKLRKYISMHPILVYVFIRRYYDFPKVLLSPLYEDLSKMLQERNLDWPEKSDLTESIDAIIRLNEFYDFDLNKIRYGKLLGDDHVINQISIKLNANDFLEIGNRAIQSGFFSQGIEWLEFSQKILLTEKEDFSTALNIVEGYLSDAIMAHDRKIRQVPRSEKNYFSEPLLLNSNYSEAHMRIKRKTLDIFKAKKAFRPERNDQMGIDVNFNALCKGEDLMSEEMKAKLHCYYQNHYMAVKVELLSTLPWIIQIYDVLNDTSIAYMKKISLAELRPSRGAEYDEEFQIYRNIRNSHGTFLEDPKDPVLISISKKIGFLTGLETLEPYQDKGYQIGAYSPGGHFIVHGDTIEDSEAANFKWGVCGDRIATFMLYLSDVEVGGGTAFVQALITAKPKKGSAILWFNKYRNGLNDKYSLHGGCPLIMGHKWIANKWICYNGQFNRLPCTLNPNE